MEFHDLPIDGQIAATMAIAQQNAAKVDFLIKELLSSKQIHRLNKALADTPLAPRIIETDGVPTVEDFEGDK